MQPNYCLLIYAGQTLCLYLAKGLPETFANLSSFIVIIWREELRISWEFI